MRVMTVLRAAIWLFCMFTCVPSSAEATVTSVTVNSKSDYEQTAGYTYSVPAVIIYPRYGRGNRVGVVDWLNSSFYHFFPPTTESGTVQFTRLATGSYLFDEGYTYISVQWNKAVTEIFGPTAPLDGYEHNHLLYGSIEQSADAWEILLDAARLLKNPSLYPGSDRPAHVTTVLSSGSSQGGALQLELLAEKLDPTTVYDGHLIQMIGLANVLGIGKSAFFTRNQTNPNWRQYEMAGIAHLPEPIFAAGPLNQNHADARPVFRAAFANLTKWTHVNEPPPEARYFRGSVDATDTFIPAPDVDGHFAGGIRLPHVASRIHGRRAGAPLGLHTPLSTST